MDAVMADPAMREHLCGPELRKAAKTRAVL
ncbi:hypothetical protein SAMN04487779_10455 [Belnapia rosea]|uniref:Uncharacterized protein n=1 Tax=Belnapia rosea TaxID=938405 RepID=A0A1G7DFX5_9PROT|nr:hypothetical protein SAMN04487779_10455 [Belnapia rosea]